MQGTSTRLYEGGIRPAPVLHRAAPAQQVDPFIWLMKETGAKKFYLPSADYIWPRVLNKRVR